MAELKKKAKAMISDNIIEIGIIYLVLFILGGLIPGGNMSFLNFDEYIRLENWQNVELRVGSPFGLLLTILQVFAMGVFFITYLFVARQKMSGGRVEVADVFIFSRGQWADFGLLHLLRQTYIFLWTLLLVIPGIIKAYAYAMTMFVYDEDRSLTYREAIKKSRHLMRGYKMELFLLDLSFLGWYFIGLFTFGVLWLWVRPYHFQTRYLFYLKVKEARRFF